MLSGTRQRVVPLVVVLLLGACGPDGDGGAAAADRCDPTVHAIDQRVQIGAAGWDASGYPLDPPVTPPPGSCLRFVDDVPLEPGDPQPYGARLWRYALPTGVDIEKLCTSALRALQDAGPVGLNPDPCVPTPSTGLASGSGLPDGDPIVTHRFDARRLDDVVVTVIVLATTSDCSGDPEEGPTGELQDCITLVVGFRRLTG